jgi:acetyl esterase/lipase
MPKENTIQIERPEIADFAAAGITVLEGLEYGRGGTIPLLMDSFYQPGARLPMPVIIWIHVGGFTEEQLTRQSRPELSFVKLAARGYFIASIDYRLAQVKPFPAQIEDCKCAVRFLRANAGRFGLDADHIGVWGESCGGQLAGLMAVEEGNPQFEGDGGWAGTSSSIQAAVSWYGGFDILAFEQMLKDPRFLVMYGGSADEKRELVRDASPITYVDKKLAPFLAMCSDSDPRVPSAQGVEFCRRARAAGNDATDIIVPNQGHGYFQGDEFYEVVFAFFDKHLKAF